MIGEITSTRSLLGNRTPRFMVELSSNSLIAPSRRQEGNSRELIAGRPFVASFPTDARLFQGIVVSPRVRNVGNCTTQGWRDETVRDFKTVDFLLSMTIHERKHPVRFLQKAFDMIRNAYKTYARGRTPFSSRSRGYPVPLSALAMKYFLCLMVVVACEAARLPRVTDQGYFQGYQGGFPNNDASAYQNVQGNGGAAAFFGDYRGQEGNLGLGSEFFPHQAPIGGRQDLNHLPGVPFGDVGANQVNFRAQNDGHPGHDFNFQPPRFY
ncbi:uncharacterized protein LOC117227770 [Megalopta genalis]|uniref:uncharacterized protein LOC117227770 n=1 Tax=Megalopta genalis TaxID=115081 RepID=UPI003FD4B22E